MSDMLYFLTLDPLGWMSSCTAEQWFTCAQAEPQTLGHSYTPGTEETVKWGNNFKQTAPGRLLSMLWVIQQRINVMLPVSHPGHITLCVTWRSDFRSHEQTVCIDTFCCDRVPSSFRRSSLASCCPKHHCMVQCRKDDFSTSSGLRHIKLLHIHWKIKGNWNSWAAPKKRCKKVFT